MALFNCPECGTQVSDKAAACPKCGAPIEKPASAKVKGAEAISSTQQKRNQPIFLVLSVIAFFLLLTTPKLLLFFPIMGSLGFSAISFFRKEKGRAGAVLIFVLTLAVLALAEYGNSLPKQSQLLVQNESSCTVDKIEIKEVTWKFVDPCRARSCASLAGAGTLINHCDIPVGVKIKLTGRGSDGSLVAVKEGWPASVSNIAPGEYSFPVDTWLDYDPAIKTIEMSVAEVKQW